jgi:hypothetical protein
MSLEFLYPFTGILINFTGILTQKTGILTKKLPDKGDILDKKWTFVADLVNNIFRGNFSE